MSDDPARVVHFVVPAGIDDPARPSGGNRYDRRVIDELGALGRLVHEHPVPGPWPRPGSADVAALQHLVAGLPDGAVVLVDGLVGSAAAGVLVPAAERLRIVVLLHMPLAEAMPEDPVRRAEGRVLAAAAGVVTTSRWARSWVVHHHRLRPARVRVAEPGVDPAEPARPSATGGELLCLGAVTAAKGHDTLLAALARIADLDWRCTCVGTLDLEPDFVARLEDDARRSGLADRVRFTGPLTGPRLGSALAATDLLVSASRRESYGMAVTEALARAVPVLVTDVGGHPEAVGVGRGLVPNREDQAPIAAVWDQTSHLRPTTTPGLLIPPDDPARLAAELRRWLGDPQARERLRAAAAERRTTLGTWAATARAVAAALDDAVVNRGGPSSVSPLTTPTVR